MKKIISLLGMLVIPTFISGCMSDNSAIGTDESEFMSVEFRVASQGTQTDVPGGQILEARNEARFTDIWGTIPSISGESPNVDFEKNQVVVILSQISACSSLEVTDVSENEYTRLVSLAEVFTSDPGLCDPTPEAFNLLEYAIIEFERKGLPVSVMYTTRYDF